MKEIRGERLAGCATPERLAEMAGRQATVEGCVHNIRALGGIAFIILRTGRYLIQTVYDQSVCKDDVAALEDGCYVAATGTVRLEQRAAGGVELLLDGFEVLSRPGRALPAEHGRPQPESDAGHQSGIPYRGAAPPA